MFEIGDEVVIHLARSDKPMLGKVENVTTRTVAARAYTDDGHPTDVVKTFSASTGKRWGYHDMWWADYVFKQPWSETIPRIERAKNRINNRGIVGSFKSLIAKLEPKDYANGTPDGAFISLEEMTHLLEKAGYLQKE